MLEFRQVDSARPSIRSYSRKLGIPLARGGGRAYNAIAGPNTPFGSYNGYWIATLRSDIAEDELRISVRDYLYGVIRGLLAAAIRI